MLLSIAWIFCIVYPYSLRILVTVISAMQIHSNVIFYLFCVQTYLGIQIFRFYFNCTRCSAEITFKTDPQNSDYTVESGANRNSEPWREDIEVSGIGHILNSFCFSVILSLNLIMLMYFLLFRLWTKRRENEKWRRWAMQ